MASLSLFDFTAYLRDIDPSQQYQIAQLSGGLVNVTVRATKLVPGHGKAIDIGRFGHHRSIIIKYAPPYIATMGEGAPFSPYRQIIEARALSFLHENPDIQATLHASRVSVPEVLHHDPTANILVISDLGEDLVTIDKWLSCSPSSSLSATVAARLGRFFAVLHNISLSPDAADAFRNKEAGEVIRREVIDRMDAALECLSVEAGEREELSKMLNEDLHHGGNQDDGDSYCAVFCLGDCWPGSILVDPNAETVGIVDWEFAGPGKPMQDLIQLGAHLRILHYTVSPIVSSFSESLFTAYNEGCVSVHAPWLRRPFIRHRAIRSAWILFGREVVFAAAESPDNIAKEVQGDWRKEAGQCGLMYLRAAKRDVIDPRLLLDTWLENVYAVAPVKY